MAGQKITVGAEEKVGFPNFSNVTYSASLERTIPDNADVTEELRKAAGEVEGWMSEQRSEVNELLVDATK